MLPSKYLFQCVGDRVATTLIEAFYGTPVDKVYQINLSCKIELESSVEQTW
jgi:hypothetical protein